MRTYATALATLATLATLEIKLSTKIRKRHPNIPPQFNTFSNIDKFDKFDKFDKTINRVEAQFMIIQKACLLTTKKRREKPLKEKRYLYYIYHIRART